MLVVQVYIIKDNVVTKQVIRTYEGDYGFEVVRLFDELGNDFAKAVEPEYYED